MKKRNMYRLVNDPLLCQKRARFSGATLGSRVAAIAAGLWCGVGSDFYFAMLSPLASIWPLRQISPKAYTRVGRGVL